jgi:agmatinase
MSEHGYTSGRLNLPFVGHCTFAKRPILTDWDRIEADVAVLGVPNDMGTQYRSGARFGPRIREASTLYLGGDVRIVDVGDVDIVHTDTAGSHD